MRRGEKLAIGVTAVAVLVALFLFELPVRGVGEPGELGRAERGVSSRAVRHASGPDPTIGDGPSAGAIEPGGDLVGLSEEILADAEADVRRQRADELEKDPNTHVVCDLGIDLPTGAAYLAIGEHSGFNGRRVEIVDGRAYLPLVYDLGELGDAIFTERNGTFTVEGYGPQRISWTERPEHGHGRCTSTVDPEPGRASLTGTLMLEPSGAPASGGWVEGCGNMAFADGHGIVHMDIVDQPCTVIAMRQDGMLRTQSEPVHVVPVPGQDITVDFVIPEARRGGLGVQVTQTDQGIIIEGLLDGGPASAAGLEAGDRVVEVDGTSAFDLELGEFVQLVGGEAGTEVGLVIERGGERFELTMVREALTPG